MSICCHALSSKRPLPCANKSVNSHINSVRYTPETSRVVAKSSWLPRFSASQEAEEEQQPQEQHTSKQKRQFPVCYNTPMEKTCRLCYQTKPITEFYKNSANRDGLDTRCKTCTKVANRRYRMSPRGRAMRTTKTGRKSAPGMQSAT